MVLFDVTLAFAITMGIAGTTVTLIMELVHRGMRVRRRRLVRLLVRWMAELERGPLYLDEPGQWRLLSRVVDNPASNSPGLRAEDLDGSPAAGRVRRLLGRAASGEAASAAPGLGGAARWRMARGGVYEKVSVEHVLRRLVEMPEIRRRISEDDKNIEWELERLSDKFEELSSGASESFRRHAQFTTLWFGLVLALLTNFDGLRIFEAFWADRALREAIIVQQSRVEAPDAVDLSGVQTLGLPIGWDFYPGCRLPGVANNDIVICKYVSENVKCIFSREALCNRLPTRILHYLAGSPGDGIAWLFRVLVTGLLIGLGAPFWFNLAKRLSQVRRMFGGQPSTEERTSGTSPDNRPAIRRELVDRIFGDAMKSEAAGIQRLLNHLTGKSVRVDGSCGDETRAALRVAYADLNPPRFPEVDSVRRIRDTLETLAIQRALKAKAMYQGPLSGRVDQATLDAVNQYYAARSERFESTEQLLADLAIAH